MEYLRALTLLSLLIPTVVAQTVQIVAVGENGFAFTPDSLTAPVGSQVEFQFYPRNHSVVSGNYNTPYVVPEKSNMSETRIGLHPFFTLDVSLMATSLAGSWQLQMGQE